MNRIRLFLLWLSVVHGIESVAFGASEFAVAHPTQGTIHRWVSLPGSLQPYQQVILCARVGGYVKSVGVDRGDVVQSGQSLAVVEIPELEADLLKAQAELEAAELESKRLREARAKSPDLVLPQSVDNAEARAGGARATVNRCKVLLDFAQIRAPFSGFISARHVDPGAHVSAGTSPLLAVVDSTKLRCQVAVTEMEAPLATPGKPVRIVPDALPSQPVQASISRSSNVLDTATRTLMVEADVDNAAGKLLAGMSVMARIGVERHENTPLVPVAALVMEKTNAFVFRHVAGKAVKTPVKIGFNDGTHVEIPGLKPEDALLLMGTVPVSDGQAVTIKTSAP